MIGVNSASVCPQYSPRPDIIACATCNMCRGSLEFTDCETPNHRRKLTDVMHRHKFLADRALFSPRFIRVRDEGRIIKVVLFVKQLRGRKHMNQEAYMCFPIPQLKPNGRISGGPMEGRSAGHEESQNLHSCYERQSSVTSYLCL